MPSRRSVTRVPSLSRWARRLAWRAGRRLYCHARGEVANAMASNGEAYVQGCVLRACEVVPGPITVFDIGANVGEWTRMLLDQTSGARGEALKVYMFEPVPSTYTKLEKNVAAMGKAVHTFQLALSDRASMDRMALLSETGGTNTLEFDDEIGANALGVIEIEKTTLATFCTDREITHIHLAKCDTEGHDLHVIKGALELLQANRIEVLQFEYNHRWIYARAFLKDVFNLLVGLPYHLARVCPAHIEVYEAWHPEMERYFEGNYVIVREPALAWFDARFGTFDVSNTFVSGTLTKRG